MRIAIRIFALLIAVSMLAEIALRVLEIGFPLMHQRHPTRGIAGIPHAEGWFLREGKAYLRFNAAGFNDREYPPAKPAGTVRIAVLGDGFVEARQLPQEQTFRIVAERELASCPALRGRRVEIMNFGSGDSGTVQQLQTLRTEVWRYQPNLVLLAFYYGNDMTDNHPVLHGAGLPRPYLMRDSAGAWKLDLSFADQPGFQETRRHRLVRDIVNASYVLQVLNAARTGAIMWSNAVASGQPDPELGLGYRLPKDAMEEEAWQMTEAALRLMKDEVAAHGAAFWIMMFGKRREQGGPYYSEARLSDFAQAQGIKLISLTRMLWAEADAAGMYLYGFPNAEPGNGYWNEHGHRAVGRFLADKLCREFLKR